uniref:Heterogeneous nuclear ribonucleoprotein n=1 Tax=Echinococcus granulosus TaxID=6210 RepID=A0A068WNQ6_ECHGR|nr:heterogeneous nuclear ribonucleoprotein [Echinococcus granulosus]
MSQERSLNDVKSVEVTTNGEENGVNKSCSSLIPENCDVHRPENNCSGSPRSNKKIFVGALTPDTTEQNLIDYFSKFGEIVSCAVKLYRDTGCSRGFGFIVFKSDESVKKVLSIPEHIVNGKKIDPKPAKCPKDTQRKVFVGGLDPDVSPKEIEEHFSKFGKVEAVETPFDSTRMRRRSYVFVVFSSEYEAKRAASIERQEINGKSCDVRVAVPREVSFRQRAMAQVTPQFSLADIQQAMLNLFYYNSLGQQPALQNHFAWPQAAHHVTNRSPFRASYDQQAAEKLFNQPTIGRSDAWYESSVARPPPPSQASVSTAPPPRNPPMAATHPYLTFPFSYQSAAAAAAAAAAATSQHFYYQATPGYYYQPAPPSVSPSEAQNSAPVPNGNVNQVPNQANAMNDFMAAIVTANQMPFITAPAASAYPTTPAGDMSYIYRQQQQQTINPAFYQSASAEGMFNDPAAGLSRSHFYGGGVLPPTSSTGAAVTAISSPLKPRGSKSHINGVHQARSAQNGHGVKEGEGVSVGSSEHPVAATTNGTSGLAPTLETQMANLEVEENQGIIWASVYPPVAPSCPARPHFDPPPKKQTSGAAVAFHMSAPTPPTFFDSLSPMCFWGFINKVSYLCTADQRILLHPFLVIFITCIATTFSSSPSYFGMHAPNQKCATRNPRDPEHSFPCCSHHSPSLPLPTTCSGASSIALYTPSLEPLVCVLRSRRQMHKGGTLGATCGRSQPASVRRIFITSLSPITLPPPSL